MAKPPDRTFSAQPHPYARYTRNSNGTDASDSSILGEYSRSARVRQLFDYVDIPRLPSVEKEQYKTMADLMIPVDEVVAEDSSEHTKFYYARHKGGIIYKFSAAPFKKQYPALVNEFLEKKLSGNLKPFDPASNEVHPMHRPKNKPQTSGRHHPTRQKVAHTVPDSENDGESELTQEDDNDYSEDDNGHVSDDASFRSDSVPRRSTRSGVKRANLPYSPVKTRSQKILPIEDSDEEGMGTRRSTRNKRAIKVNLAEDTSDAASAQDDRSDSYVFTKPTTKARGKGKKKARVPAARPSYGEVCSFDNASDTDSDDESAILRRHRKFCEKCHNAPALLGLRAIQKRGPKKRRRSKEDDEESSEDEITKITNRGGWLRCMQCPVAAHWSCLAETQRSEILRVILEKDRAAWVASQDQELTETDIVRDGPRKRKGLNIDETTEFICGGCLKGGFCMECMEELSLPEAQSLKAEPAHGIDTDMVVDGEEVQPKLRGVAHPPCFRCLTCKRLSHYTCMPVTDGLPPDHSVADIAQEYQAKWLCRECNTFTYQVDKILAWRPYPPDAQEGLHASGEVPNFKSPLPRQYLVKWVDRSYRRTTWVPHMWLLTTHQGKLRNYLQKGPEFDLLDAYEKSCRHKDDAAKDIGDVPPTSTPTSLESSPFPRTLAPLVDAESKIPVPWKSVDRILDMHLLLPSKSKKKKGKKAGAKTTVISDSEEDLSEDDQRVYRAALDDGEQPAATETIAQWERRNGREFTINDIGRVVWVFVKWQELGYDDASWDSPPRPEDVTYQAFKRAVLRFLASRQVIIPTYNKAQRAKFENRRPHEYQKSYALKKAEDLRLATDPSLKLLDFQVDGFNWLCDHWWRKHPCILADEMGLGKTVQVSSFIGKIALEWQAYPVLVVVPNATISNWVREFERWAPNLTVVPFYGEAKGRDIVKKYELSHSDKSGRKFHVLVATYESVTNPRDYGVVFKSQPIWEVLVVDEGQRLKSDNSLLFRKLGELNVAHRVLMTGTPLNNNIRELFNLMNFLDPGQWNDLEKLEKEYEILTDDLIKQLHERLRPYFLRRLKADVLKLPPKNEIIVPLSMSPLQKEIYKSILSHNANLLKGLKQASGIMRGGGNQKTKLNNVIMHLRKCLQHPYLYSDDIEPRGLAPHETHEKLVDASAKLRLLKIMLPKLKARGHRVLLFSQFVIVLNIIEDFLNGENIKYLRLDGSTKGSERQKGIDEFNKQGSDIFIYLLTTRAGGVGINLFTADTVIIFDPDFNPHQDLQAIARAHRFGQQKPVLVFKLMVKDSAEDRIMQIGKKKLVLDHLIVQKMDDDEDAGQDVQSILTYGAQALFATDQEHRDITYSESDVDNLITKTEQEGDKLESQDGSSSAAFTFAKVWTSEKENAEEVGDEDQTDSWALTLQKIMEERGNELQAEANASGRGAKRRAAAAILKPNLYMEDDSPVKPKRQKRPKNDGKDNTMSDGSAYSDHGPDPLSSDDSSDGEIEENEGKNPKPPLAAIQNLGPLPGMQLCGLCGRLHAAGPGECEMTDSSEHLIEYRRMLLLNADDEPYEDRIAAIRAIDETLLKRGHQGMAVHQPLHIVRDAPTLSIRPSAKPQPSQAPSGLEHTAQRVKVPNQGVNVFPRQYVPEKRALSPPVASGSQKKPRMLAVCPVCSGGPHDLDDCPTVRVGPRGVAAAIALLERKDGSATTITALRRLLKNQKRVAQPAI